MAKAKRVRDAGVRVDGMKEFRRDLKRLTEDGGSDGRYLLKAANLRVAIHVRKHAVQRAARIGDMQFAAALSMKTKSTATAAQLVMGNDPNVPYFDGAEFGARRNRLRARRSGSYIGLQQFKDWKQPGSGNTGYFLFPTMRAESEAIKEIWAKEFDRISDKVFPDGR